MHNVVDLILKMPIFLGTFFAVRVWELLNFLPWEKTTNLVMPLIGVALGGSIAGRQSDRQLHEKRIEILTQSLMEFATNANNCSTRLYEQISETESANLLSQAKETSESNRRRESLAEINHIHGFISRYLGDLKGHVIALYVISDEIKLNNAIENFHLALAGRFKLLAQTQERYQVKSEELANTLRNLNENWVNSSSPQSQSEFYTFSQRLDAETRRLQETLTEWRGVILEDAIKIGMDNEVAALLEVGKDTLSNLRLNEPKRIRLLKPFKRSR